MGLASSIEVLRRSKRRAAVEIDDEKIYGQDYGILPSD